MDTQLHGQRIPSYIWSYIYTRKAISRPARLPDSLTARFNLQLREKIRWFLAAVHTVD